MAVKRWQWHQYRPGGKRGRDEEELAARLAPLEETDAFEESGQRNGSAKRDDTIRVDRNSVRMPERFLEEERDAAEVFRLDPAVLFILIVMLVFIAFVAWQISLMPAK